MKAKWPRQPRLVSLRSLAIGHSQVCREGEVDSQKRDRHRTYAPQSLRYGCGASPLLTGHGSCSVIGHSVVPTLRVVRYSTQGIEPS